MKPLLPVLAALVLAGCDPVLAWRLRCNGPLDQACRGLRSVNLDDPEPCRGQRVKASGIGVVPGTRIGIVMETWHADEVGNRVVDTTTSLDDAVADGNGTFAFEFVVPDGRFEHLVLNLENEGQRAGRGVTVKPACP